MENYKKLRDQILLQQDIDPDTKTIDVRDYAKHVLSNGNVGQKRELTKLFDYQLYLHEETITGTPQR